MVGNDQRRSFGKEFLPADQSLELPPSAKEMQFFGSKIARERREGGRLTRNGSGGGTAAARKTKINRSLSAKEGIRDPFILPSLSTNFR